MDKYTQTIDLYVVEKDNEYLTPEYKYESFGENTMCLCEEEYNSIESFLLYHSGIFIGPENEDSVRKGKVVKVRQTTISEVVEDDEVEINTLSEYVISLLQENTELEIENTGIDVIIRVLKKKNEELEEEIENTKEEIEQLKRDLFDTINY